MEKCRIHRGLARGLIFLEDANRRVLRNQDEDSVLQEWWDDLDSATMRKVSLSLPLIVEVRSMIDAEVSEVDISGRAYIM